MRNKRGMHLHLNLNLPLLLKHYLCVSQSVLPDEEGEQHPCETISDVNVTDQSEHYEEEEEEQQEEKAEADQCEKQEHGAATKEEAERRVTLMGMGSCSTAVEVDVYTVRTSEMLWSLSLSATDEHGDVAFTVPRPSSNSNSIDTPIFLVDSQGSPLFTMFSRPMALGLAGYRWDAYPGDVGVDPGRCHYRDKQHHSLPLPLFHAWSRGNRTTCVVMVSNLHSPKNSSNSSEGRGAEQHYYSVEGSYAERNCIIYKAPRIVVAEIKRKCANWKVMLGKDVYNVVIRRQGTDASFIMALVAILHHMSPRHSNSS